jgi:hypothetical protein
VTVQRQVLTHTTHQIINHAPVIGAYAAGLPLVAAPGLPLVAAAPAAAAEETKAEPAAVEQA